MSKRRPMRIGWCKQVRRDGAGSRISTLLRRPHGGGLLDDVGLVLVMTVNPGFGSQAFIERMVPR
ncbi:MAG: hypothetical protein H6638_06300 [Ardenticatenales bacterium]|nr:hypothetical protein [Ardenticatenales bacterium]